MLLSVVDVEITDKIFCLFLKITEVIVKALPWVQDFTPEEIQ